jgi:hypothetical protein
MTCLFPTPFVTPFKRLQVSNGLLINAERWQCAHDYHRQRQNVHYQSLNQPGIVWGLGVRVIPAPQDVAEVYRDERWVEIQSGIAIDVAGNFIVIQKPVRFRIATELKDTQPLTVYLVAKYRDPDVLNNQNSTEIVEETFRIDEKSSPPDSLEVELCRILLHVDKKAITQPKDVFFPGYADLDLRHRRQAQARPQGFVRLAQVNSDDPECSQNFFNLMYLLQAVEALYPPLQGANIEQVNWDGDLDAYDLLYLTGQQGLSLNAPQVDAIAAYLKHGGTLLIDAPPEATALIYSTHALANKLNTPLKSLKEARRDHPLRTRPFLFAALPVVNQQMVQMLTGGGIILTIGNIGAMWGLDEALSLPRTTIRTMQELGVNILNYAWKRRQLTSLSQSESVC